MDAAHGNSKCSQSEYHKMSKKDRDKATALLKIHKKPMKVLHMMDGTTVNNRRQIFYIQMQLALQAEKELGKGYHPKSDLASQWRACALLQPEVNQDIFDINVSSGIASEATITLINRVGCDMFAQLLKSKDHFHTPVASIDAVSIITY